MAGEILEDHIIVKDILVEMGTYFQVQVIVYCIWKSLISFDYWKIAWR